jgi:hypothetical protein
MSYQRFLGIAPNLGKPEGDGWAFVVEIGMFFPMFAKVRTRTPA